MNNPPRRPPPDGITLEQALVPHLTPHPQASPDGLDFVSAFDADYPTDGSHPPEADDHR